MKGKLIQNKYLILQSLGQDAFSKTFLAKDSNWLLNRRYIIKKFRPVLGNPEAESMRQLFYREASILKRLSGKNCQIPRLYEYFMDGEDFYLVREWINGLTLEQKVRQQGKLSVEEVEHILDSILTCLKYIHSYGIVYRQLKPSSIVLRQNSWSRQSQHDYLPVPIYFGAVKEIAIKPERQDRRNLVLTNQHEYIPVEQQQGKSVYASDLYSLGLIAIYLLTGKSPAELPCDPQTKELLWHQEVPGIKIHLVRVINRAIYSYTQDRFTSAEAMLQALHSPPISLSMPIVYESGKKSYLSSDFKIISALSSLSVGVLGITFVLLNANSSQFTKNNFEQIASLLQVNAKSQKLKPLSNVKSIEAIIPVFPIGTPLKRITSFLGKPTEIVKGGQNSNAHLYRDFIPNRVDLGYLSDARTQTIRQSEISFADSVDLLTIQHSAQKLLREDYSLAIEQKINQVYFKISDRQEFEINNLLGVVRRNPQNYIYISIWDKDFHEITYKKPIK
ncbi:MAG TPA: serine/threonine-protein kinase [Coleofasciculaceae cyanobacterium]|jgi:serine/threonine-protein kinase